MVLGWFKNRSATPQVVDLGASVLVSDKSDPESKLFDYMEAYFATPVEEILDEIFSGEVATYSAYQMGKLTKGQWLLAVLSEFRFQVNNGGIAQFILNQPNLVDDVQIALRMLKMDDLAAEYEATLQPILRVSFDNRGSAKGTLLSFMKAQHKDYITMAEQAEQSGFDNKFYSSGDERLIEHLVDYMISNPGDYQKMHN